MSKGIVRQVFAQKGEFLLKSQTMKHPLDLVGSRRAFVMLNVLHDVLEKKEPANDVQIPLNEINPQVEIESQKVTYELNGKLSQTRIYVMTASFVFLKFFPLNVFDWGSDAWVLRSNYLLNENVTLVGFRMYL